jgi:hypothetical protein
LSGLGSYPAGNTRERDRTEVVEMSLDQSSSWQASSGRARRAEESEVSDETEPESGREWDAEAPGRTDDRDLENLDLDIECINAALERKYGA